MIYLDNAATSFPKPQCVVDAVLRAMQSFGNPLRGSHDAALSATRGVERARAEIADFFGCVRPERTAFTKNATEALNIAVTSLDGHFVTTEAEHNSVLRPVFRKGDFTVVPVDALGRCAVDDVRRACRKDTIAVAIGHASNVTGNVAPVAEIGRFCRERDMLFILDAAQTAGLIDIDMERLGVDALCFTGHKSLHGPQGTGGICLSERFAPRPLIVGGGGSLSFEPVQPPETPGVLEAGTLNSHGIAGLAAGIDFVRELGPDRLLAGANRLAALFRGGMQALENIVVYGDHEALERVPIVTINIGDMPSSDVAALLAEEHGIAVRAGAHCAPLLHTRFGTVKQGAVRFSFSHQNTEDEVAKTIEAVADISRRNRRR